MRMHVVHVGRVVVFVGLLFMLVRMAMFRYRVIMNMVMVSVRVAMAMFMDNRFMFMDMLMPLCCRKIRTEYHDDECDDKCYRYWLSVYEKR